MADVTETPEAGEAAPVEVVEGGAEATEGGEPTEQEQGGETVEGEHVAGEQVEGEEVGGEHVEGEELQGEQLEGEQLEGEHTEGEQTESEAEGVQGEELAGEGLEGEQLEGEEKKEEAPVEEVVEEEEVYVEPPPPDPAAPFDFSDSKELLREPFSLRNDQLAELEMLWEYFQDYTPAYSDIDNYITEKELVYMIESLNIMTVTPEQFQELIAFCCRPPHPKGHITFEQFVKMVTLRQRDITIEDELRSALQVLDPDKTGTVDREYFKELMGKTCYKLSPKQLDFLIKEVDISGDGTLGIDDIVGTMCIDLNKEDLMMLRNQVYPDGAPVAAAEEED